MSFYFSIQKYFSIKKPPYINHLIRAIQEPDFFWAWIVKRLDCSRVKTQFESGQA